MNGYDFGSFISQPGRDLMAQARLAWKYGTTRPGTQNGRIDRNPRAWYRVVSIGSFLTYEDVGMGLAAVDECEIDGDFETEDKWCGSRYGYLIRDDKLFDGEVGPRVWAAQSADGFLGHYDQGSFYPGLTSGSATNEISFDASTGGFSAYNHESEFDMLICDTTLQWHQSHDELIPNLLRMMKSGGVFAASIPLFGKGVEFRHPRAWVEGHIAGYTTTQIQYSRATPFTTFTALHPDEYGELFDGEWLHDYRMVETVYCTTLHGVESIEEWCEKSGVRGIIDFWDSEARAERQRGEIGAVEEELLKWLRAGDPTPVAGGIRLRYPFLLMTAVMW